MQNASVKKNLLPAVLIVAAALALVLTLLFAFRGSADEPKKEIDDYGWQSISGDTPESDSTALRFLFSIGSLEYERVGFVLSKTNTNPKIGENGCTNYETTVVYGAVRADGDLVPAPNGRHWVAVKVTNVPNASFDKPIYLKPYVKDGTA